MEVNFVRKYLWNVSSFFSSMYLSSYLSICQHSSFDFFQSRYLKTPKNEWWEINFYTDD
jgi:hypothetical protein